VSDSRSYQDQSLDLVRAFDRLEYQVKLARTQAAERNYSGALTTLAGIEVYVDSARSRVIAETVDRAG
jgi:hypothetical protein